MHEEISASHLISIGMDLEENQRHLAAIAGKLNPNSTDRQRTEIQLRSSTLRRKIESWIPIQHMYIPGLRLMRTLADDDQQSQQEIDMHSVPLFLPSALPSTVTCDSRLLLIEWKLRSAQASDALDDLREALRVRSFILIDKKLHQRGQIANTRTNDVIARFQTKVDSAVNRYRAARAALENLACHLNVEEEWKEAYPILKEQDIRGMAAEEDDSAVARKKRRKLPGGKEKEVGSEGHKRLSWIWTHSGIGKQAEGDRGLTDALRIEWCKGRARRDRWREEVELLEEEMKRVKLTFLHRADIWDHRACDLETWSLPGIFGNDEAFLEGRIAFARQQKGQYLAMHQHCEQVWENVNIFIALEGRTEIIPTAMPAVDDDDTI